MEKFKPLNLASKPVRNKRLFYFITLILTILGLLLVSFNIYSFIQNFEKNREIARSISELNNKIVKLQRQKKLYSAKIKRLELKYGKEVEAINDLIFKKSFSWVSLLSMLEKTLPNRIIILSLRPELKEKRVEIKLDFAAKTISDFLAFIDSLRKNGFQGVQVKGERKDERGIIISSLSFFYPREEI